MTIYIGIASRADSDWVKAMKGQYGLMPRPPKEVVRPSSVKITVRSPPDSSEESASVHKVGLWLPTSPLLSPLFHSSPCSQDGSWPLLNCTAFSLRFSLEPATPQIDLLSLLKAVQAFRLQ